ncbi:MAG: hypothetical protein WBP16_16950 [Ferruginibacter sp.]
MKNNLPFTTDFFVIMPLLFFISFAIDGFDQASIPTVSWFFPWACTSLLFFSAVKFPFILIGALQYPIYGFLLDRYTSKKQRFIVCCFILVTHFFLVAIIKYAVADPAYPAP